MHQEETEGMQERIKATTEQLIEVSICGCSAYNYIHTYAYTVYVHNRKNITNVEIHGCRVTYQYCPLSLAVW